MKQRTIGAIIVLLVFVPLVIIGGVFFKLGMIAISLLGFKELLDLKGSKKKIPLFVKVISYFLLIFLVVSPYYDKVLYTVDFRIISLILLTLLTPLVLYHNSDKYNIKDAIFLIGSEFFLGIAFNLFILIRDYSINYFIFIFLITTMTDMYAYFTGCLIGKHKLLPEVSPKKTWEGSIFGSVFGTLISFTFYYIVINPDCNIIITLLIILFLSIIGQTGDLVFSSIKRCYNRKDFSNLIPGHGGILDRFDSVIFVLLAFVIFMSIL